jgi:hypothetical protein
MPREAGSGGAAVDQHRPIVGFARRPRISDHADEE